MSHARLWTGDEVYNEIGIIQRTTAVGVAGTLCDRFPRRGVTLFNISVANWNKRVWLPGHVTKTLPWHDYSIKYPEAFVTETEF